MLPTHDLTLTHYDSADAAKLMEYTFYVLLLRRDDGG